MTYCVGLKIDRGLVFMSDTRTNAGMDSISTFRKMHVWEQPGERVIVLMSAGNLATTQAVVSLLDERTKAIADRHATLLETPSMYQTVRLVGDTVKEVIASSSPAGSCRCERGVGAGTCAQAARTHLPVPKPPG